MNLLAVVNQSTRMSDDDVALATRACAYQLHHHVAPAWNIVAPAVVFYPADAMHSVPPGAQILAVLDDSDQAGVLGWHSEGPEGQIIERSFVSPVLDNGGTTVDGQLSVASVMSHEAIETMIDPQINRWAQAPDGTLVAVEACDPVESDSYVVRIGGKPVTVSDFVLPAWFDDSPAPGSGTHYLAGRSAELAALGPFSLAKGGYMVSWAAGGQPTEVFGDAYPEWRKATKASPLARTARRVTR